MRTEGIACCNLPRLEDLIHCLLWKLDTIIIIDEYIYNSLFICLT